MLKTALSNYNNKPSRVYREKGNKKKKTESGVFCRECVSGLTCQKCEIFLKRSLVTVNFWVHKFGEWDLMNKRAHHMTATLSTHAKNTKKSSDSFAYYICKFLKRRHKAIIEHVLR